MKYIGNAFSLQMLKDNQGIIKFEEISQQDFKTETNNAHSIVGHQDTANILNVEMHRENISLQKGDILFVAQVIGGRLPEGATELPQGFKFKFLKVEIDE